MTLKGGYFRGSRHQRGGVFKGTRRQIGGTKKSNRRRRRGLRLKRQRRIQGGIVPALIPLIAAGIGALGTVGASATHAAISR